MATSTTRSSSEVWLIGKPSESLSKARLPSKEDALKRLIFHHITNKMTLKKGVRATVEDVLEIWEMARIPTQRIDAIERKLNKLYNDYLSLKKNMKTPLDSCRMKEEIFKGDLSDLFDVAHKDALQMMKIDEDKQFLIMQREDTKSCSMAGVDKKLKAQECRKRMRRSQDESRRQRSVEEIQNMYTSIVSSTSNEVSFSSSSDESDSNYKPSTSISPKLSIKKKKILTTNVAASLDRVSLLDRKAMFVISAVSEACGLNLNQLSASRSTIRRNRMKKRETEAENDKATFISDDPLFLHWDGKLLPDIVGGTEKVDRIAILVTGGGEEKLLGVPKIVSGTGQEQATACLNALKDWNLRKNVRALVLDTTAANTGLKSGACAIIEESLGTSLVWIPCRHHVLEIMLSSVFSTAFGVSGGPDVAIFKRFQKQWPQINKEDYSHGSNDLFFSNAPMEHLRKEMIGYYTRILEHPQQSKLPRDDYLELLQLCNMFLGGTNPGHIVKFRAPGGLHNARWMAKAIYSLKIYLFRNQFTLTSREEKGITEVCLFVALIYGQHWNEAPKPEKAVMNDLILLKQIEAYPNETVRKAASAAFLRHLWFFSEHLVGLAFFDSRVSDATKVEMVKNLHRPPKAKALKRLESKTFKIDSPLETYVTEKTKELFDILLTNGKEKANSFLCKDPKLWPLDENFIELKEKVYQMKIVNDCAERGIALIQTYNSSITKNEEQFQYLLRLVQLHRKQFPTPKKKTLMTDKDRNQVQ